MQRQQPHVPPQKGTKRPGQGKRLICGKSRVCVRACQTMCDEHRDLFDISFHARSGCTPRLLTQAAGMLPSSPPGRVGCCPRAPVTAPGHQRHEVSSPPWRFQRRAVAPAACHRLGAWQQWRGGYLLRPACRSSPHLSVLPPSLSHAAEFAWSWGSFLHGALWNQTSESRLPNANTEGGNTVQAAKTFTASKSFPVSGSLH